MITATLPIEITTSSGREVEVTLSIMGEVENNSFDHAFGTEKLPDFVAFNDWEVEHAFYLDNGTRAIVDGAMMDLIREVLPSEEKMTEALEEEFEAGKMDCDDCDADDDHWED